MLGPFMTSWHLNTWKDKIWLSYERKKLSKWNKKYFFLFHKCPSLDLQNKLAKMQRTQPLSSATTNPLLSSRDALGIKLFWKHTTNVQENTHVKVQFQYSCKAIFIEITGRCGCSPVNLLDIFRMLFPKNTSGRLLLNLLVLAIRNCYS